MIVNVIQDMPLSFLLPLIYACHINIQIYIQISKIKTFLIQGSQREECPFTFLKFCPG